MQGREDAQRGYMDAIAQVLAETGVLKGKRRRAVDSTVLDDTVARQDTITQLIAGVRRFGRDVPATPQPRHPKRPQGRPEHTNAPDQPRKALSSARP